MLLFSFFFVNSVWIISCYVLMISLKILFFLFVVYTLYFLSVALQHIEDRTCNICNKIFSRKEHFKRHWVEQHLDTNIGSFDCKNCGRKFKRKYHRARHESNCPNVMIKTQNLTCHTCQINFKDESDLFFHCNSHHYFEVGNQTFSGSAILWIFN